MIHKFRSLRLPGRLFSLQSLRNLPLTLALMTLVSCQNTPIQKTSPVDKSHWVKTSHQPPSYVARGYDPAAGTTSSEGEWIETGDAVGSRYFIPFRVTEPLSKTELVKEAMAARTEKKQRAITSDNKKELAKDVGLNLLAAPLHVMRVAAFIWPQM